MWIKQQQPIQIYIIRGSAIRNFVLIELVAGTGIYYVVKLICSSVMLGMIGSIVSVEGIKRAIKK